MLVFMTASATPRYFVPGSVAWLSSQGHPGWGPDFASVVWWTIVDRTALTGTEFAQLDGARQSALVWDGIAKAKARMLDRTSW